jgi:beta-galactosidase
MKKSLLLGLSMLVAGFIQAQTPDWENPAIFARQAEDLRATFIPYQSAEAALSGHYDHSAYYRSLSGVWKFKWVPKPADRPAGFYEDSYDVSSWDNFTIPGTW